MYRKYIKRLLDIVISLTALVVLSPVLLIVAILVRCKLGSPVIFHQQRPGYNEKIFKLCKFRTMTDERDENGEFIRIPHKHPNGNVTYSIKCTPITEKNWKDCADYHIEGEVSTYDKYLRGDVYGFVLTKKVIEQEKCPHCGEIIREWEDEDDIDSCWGFYGDCLEDNGILDNLGKDLKFKEEE